MLRILLKAAQPRRNRLGATDLIVPVSTLVIRNCLRYNRRGSHHPISDRTTCEEEMSIYSTNSPWLITSDAQVEDVSSPTFEMKNVKKQKRR
ncbi:MAG: hypothetical protein WHU54_08670 [Candidatus Bathyarchaeia archaeon]